MLAWALLITVCQRQCGDGMGKSVNVCLAMPHVVRKRNSARQDMIVTVAHWLRRVSPRHLAVDAVTNTEVVCWLGCPTPCGPEQMSCDSVDANGCQMPGQCVDNQTPSMYGDGTCYGFCPLDCGADMMPCPGGSDANGCEMQGTCVMMGDSCDTGYVAP